MSLTVAVRFRSMRPLVLTAAAVLALVATGCSDVADEGSASESSAPVAAPTPTPALTPTPAPTTTPAARTADATVTTSDGAVATAVTAASAPTTAPAEAATAAMAEPVRVLVTNDDGVAAEGIDFVVQALLSIESPVFEVTVVAPAGEQSGQGGNTTPGELAASESTTASGHSAMAVAGFPADTIIWALDQILAHDEGSPVTEVVSINTPTCSLGGEIRGTVEVPLGLDLQGYDYGAPADCASTFENPADDVQAYFNGFVAISPTPLQPAAG